MLVTPAYSMPLQPHIPLNSSPLSQRSANVNAAFFPSQSLFYGMTESENVPAQKQSISTYARRQHKPTPFSGRTRDDQRERRRDLFLKRVDQTRDDKRWKGRSEEILRCDHFAQQRRWKEAHESQPDLDLDELLAETEEPMYASSALSEPITTSAQSQFQVYSDPVIDEVDEVAEQEQLEMQEWAEFLAATSGCVQEPQHRRADHRPDHEDSNSQMTDYDDDEYDSVFMELIEQRPTHPQPHTADMDTKMDLSS